MNEKARLYCAFYGTPMRRLNDARTEFLTLRKMQTESHPIPPWVETWFGKHFGWDVPPDNTERLT